MGNRIRGFWEIRGFPFGKPEQLPGTDSAASLFLDQHGVPAICRVLTLHQTEGPGPIASDAAVTQPRVCSHAS